jgi:hypothetical protein
MTRSHRFVAALLIVSSLTHMAQLAVYARDTHVIAATAFGVVYFTVGLLLVRGSRAGLWLALTLRSVGGVLGVWRFAFVHRNPFSVFHVVLDVLVVPIGRYLVFRGHKARHAAGSRAAEADRRPSSVARPSGGGHRRLRGTVVRLKFHPSGKEGCPG